MVPRAALLLPALLALATAAPAQWSETRRVWPEEKPDRDYYFDHFSLAADGSGNFVATWEESEPIGGGSYVDLGSATTRTTFPADRWTTPQLLLGPPPPADLMQSRPFVAGSPDGTFLHFHIDQSLWNAFRVNVCRWHEGSQTWSNPAPLPDDPTVPAPQEGHEASGVHAAADGQGNWIAAWEKGMPGGDIYTGVDLVYSVSLDNGATWSVPRQLHPPSAHPEIDEVHVRLASDGAGTWVAGWNSGVRARLGFFRQERDIWVARSTDAGETWSTPLKLNPYSPAQYYVVDRGPELAVDGTGNWVALWTALTMENFRQVNRGFLCRSTDGGATWSSFETLPLDQAKVSPVGGVPSAGFDAHGNLLVVLQGDQTLTPIRDTGFDLVSVVSPDLGMRWSPPRPVNFVEGDPAGPNNGYVDDLTPRLRRGNEHDWLVTWIRHEVVFPRPGLLSITHAGPRYTTGTLELNLAVEPSEIDFGTEYTHRPPLAWRNVAIRLPEETLGSARPSGYSISNGFRYLDEFDFTPMLPGETRLLRVYFHPLEAGEFIGTFEVTFDNPPATVSVSLRGVGAHPFHGLQVLGE